MKSTPHTSSSSQLNRRIRYGAVVDFVVIDIGMLVSTTNLCASIASSLVI